MSIEQVFFYFSKSVVSIKVFLKKVPRDKFVKKKECSAKYFVVSDVNISLCIFLLLIFLSIINQLLPCEGLVLNAF